MAESAFFYNTTTQRRDSKKALNPHTNIGQPIKPIIKRGKSGSSAQDDSAPPLVRTTTQSSQSSIEPSKTPLPKKKSGSYQYSNPSFSGDGVPLAERKYTRTTSLQRTDTNSGRASSVSSGSVTASSLSTPVASDTTKRSGFLEKPFTWKNGRRYLRDPSIPYPLPCDLTEMHRQILRTMLLVQVLGGPVCSPSFQNKAPKNVLEVACGSAYWSSLCHQHFMRKGHSVSFTGLDVAPLAPDMNLEENMKWTFVQHDFRKTPFPFKNEEFDLVMVKDVSLATRTIGVQQDLMDEYLRILSPGGILEVWEGDHTLRMLLPHSPPTSSSEDSSDNEELERAKATGTYTITAQTPLTAPHNQFLLDYNAWISKALESRKLSPVPCAHVRSMLLQESEGLEDIESRRLAIPLGEVRWEREGVGVASSVDGQSSQDTPTTSKASEADRRILSTAQSALRRTALLTVVQMIEALEPLLREAAGKGQDEWDRWLNNLMNDLMMQNGTSWGECLEVGAWWATKKANWIAPPKKPSLALDVDGAEKTRGKGPNSPSFRSPVYILPMTLIL